jgi:ArsR family transcriptional regulator
MLGSCTPRDPGGQQKHAKGKDREMEALIKIMKALSTPNRIRIIKLLQHRSMCVGEIQSALGVSQPSISKHLRVLFDADLVNFHRQGKLVNYCLSQGRGNPYAATILGNIRNWLREEPETADFLENHVR